MKGYLRTQQNQGIIDSFPDMFANYQANQPASMLLVLLRSACHASSARTCEQAELLPFPDLALASLYGHFAPVTLPPILEREIYLKRACFGSWLIGRGILYL